MSEFLADSINGCTYATRCHLLSVTCIVA